MKREDATAFGALLSFSLFGSNLKGDVAVSGTGFRIAPSLALTAKHVCDDIVRRLALPEGVHIPQGQTSVEGVRLVAAQQELGSWSTDLTPWWHVSGRFDSKVTDISLLLLLPGNHAARRADENDTYLQWSLSPPAVNQELWAFGYAQTSIDGAGSAQNQIITVEYNYSIETVTVTKVFENGRREVPLDVPDILGVRRGIGMAQSPCFEVRGRLTPSMSGGPIFNGNVIYGVVSTGTRERAEDGSEQCTVGTGTLLRPLLAMSAVSLGEGQPTVRIADLVARGAIRTV